MSLPWTFKPLDISALSAPPKPPLPPAPTGVSAAPVEPEEDAVMSAPDDETAIADTATSETPAVAPSVETPATEESPVIPAPASEPIEPASRGTTPKDPTPEPVSEDASVETTETISLDKGLPPVDVPMATDPVENDASAEASASPVPTPAIAPATDRESSAAPPTPPTASDKGKGRASPASEPPADLPIRDASNVQPEEDPASPGDLPVRAASEASGVLSEHVPSPADEATAELPSREGSPSLSEGPREEQDDQIEDDSEDERPLSHNFPAQPRASTSALASNHHASTSTSTLTPVKSKKRPRTSNSGPDSASAITGNTAAQLALPHYTIKRSSPNSKANPHVLSLNASVTDASSSRWPKGNDLIVGNVSQGAKCWYDPQPIDEGRNLNWRIKIAESLAEMLGETNELAGGKKEAWILEDWPAGYKFFIHHSGRTGDKDRLDPYLFGSFVTSKFRTVNEFLPHLQWLLMNAPCQRLSCKCKYCTHSTQGNVNRIVGLDSTRMPSSAPPASKKARLSSASPAPKQRDPEAKKKHHRHLMGAPSTKPRDATAPKPAATKATAPKAAPAKKQPQPTYDGAFVDPMRDQELAEGALFRRGEMVWAELPRALTNGTSFSITHWPAIVGERKPASQATLLDPGKAGTAPTFKVVQRWTYQVQLIALEAKISREETELKAWLSYESSMPTDLETIIAPASVDLVYDGAHVLRPKLAMLKSPALAATPYALAMQIAAHVVASFSLIDRYQLKKSHIISPADLTSKEKADRNKHLEQWHYNSLWWGGEHIWAGELVRFLTDGNVIRPGEQSEGAEHRGCFFKIAAIYKNAEAQTGNVIGVVYELAEVSVSGGNVNVASGGSAMSAFEKKAPSGGAKEKGEEMFMPAPPPGYVFRRLTPAGAAAHLDIEYVAGRYYPLPEALQTPAKMVEIMTKLRYSARTPEGEEPLEEDSYLSEEERAFVLAGLAPAYRAYMKCHGWVADRKTAMIKAENTSRKEMGDFIAQARPRA